MRIEYHRTLIADRVRNEAFASALADAIEPGKTVVADIGAGTGLLALMATKLGAREVYLYEAAEVAGVAEKILKANRARNCHLIPCHSTEMQDPPKVDLIISETLGNYPFEEDIIETLNDARRRFLKRGGRIIPNRIEQFVAPVITDRFHRELCAWDDVGFDLDLRSAKRMSLNNIYVRTLQIEDLLNKGRNAKAWDGVDFTKRNSSNRNGEVSWRLLSAKTIYGFATWWTAELMPSVHLSTVPDAPRTHWEQLYFPLMSPIKARPGETIAITLRSRTSRDAGTHIAWTVEVRDANDSQRERQSMNLDKGYLP